MSQDPELRAHQEWLGYLQPVGLVASPAALRDAQAHVNKNIIPEQSILIRSVLGDTTESTKRGEEPEPRLKDFPAFTRHFWQWEPTDLAGGPGGPELPATLEVPLPEYGEILSPTYGVPDPANPGSWLMLIEVRADNAALDEAPEEIPHEKRWQASPQARFERLLRANQIPIGLIVTPHLIRLVYAPRGESTGHLTFPFKAMCEVAGRPIVAALDLLLEAGRLFFLPTNQRLPWILQQSRKYQNEVSTKLAEQVLRALNELMRGFQSANEATTGELLRQVLQEAPEEVYGGLLTTLLRMVFILYAEDRGLLSTDPVYLGSYSLSGLFERLREDDAQYPDTMDQRFGAWTQFLTLCRLIYDGGGHGAMNLPPRHGRLFDPDAYAFLEGRSFHSKRSPEETITPPRVSDGVIFRVLQDLLMLDGDRLSYRSLDVEQIGSVYEAMMGFEVRTAQGTSIGLRPDHVVVNLNDLLGKSAADRVKVLKDDAGCDLTGKALEQLKSAMTIEEIVSALGRRVSHLYLDQRGMPLLIAAAGMFLQPTEERRRSGSHYTPRSLTEPIVRTTLEPILKQLGEKPRPEQILDLKVCDVAMGSGAFLVEACRFLAEALVEAWSVHGDTPIMPPDQEPVLHARRLIAQRCLYGVDKNPFAVDLSKLSLWLATLAKDHPFTFLDHSLRCGDSLVGLTRQQIAAFNWLPAGQQSFLEQELRKRIERVSEFRQRILAARDEVPYEQLRQQLDRAEDAVFPLRQAGDAVIAAFFSADKPRAKEEKRMELQSYVETAFRQPGQPEHEQPIENAVRSLSDKRMNPFHWELEFPEVFRSDADRGFDAIVGNPPFAGHVTSVAAHTQGYTDYLRTIITETGGKCDLVAFFFRKAFDLLKHKATFGLIATNTISQGDTRESGLRWICTHGGTIYEAVRRLKWPGQAAVTVSVVHVINGSYPDARRLDGRDVGEITAFLFHAGGHNNPQPLQENRGRVFQGSVIRGVGFTFDDNGGSSTTSVSEMRRLLEAHPEYSRVIYPYLGGEEVNDHPTHLHHRYVINFGEMDEEEARSYPELFDIVQRKVLPARVDSKAKSSSGRIVDKFWQFGHLAKDLYAAIHSQDRVLALSRVSARFALTFLPTRTVFADTIYVFGFDDYESFAVLQSPVHETWARFFASTLEDRLRYTPTDCFETFPFPRKWREDSRLETAGRAYFEYRTSLMVTSNQGLTATYNRVHDPEESSPAIVRLRELHSALDRSVLDAYCWQDLHPAYEFILDYEDSEDEEDGPRRRKKPWRYRWPDDFRDEVLARLLELNRQYSAEEQLSGGRVGSFESTKSKPKTVRKMTTPSASLFSAEDLSK